MTNQTDSFITEVTDELRRDRLFGALRRYGWIGILLVLLVVGGAAFREYSRARDRAAAEGWGDAVLAAEAAGDATALAAVDPQGSPGRAALADLLAAGRATEAGDIPAAAQALRRAADRAGEGDVLTHLALLRLAMLPAPAIEAAERDAVLARLSQGGAPFELLALEQKAVALIAADRHPDAITLIRQIQARDGLSDALRRRLSEMMIALGVPEAASEAAAGSAASLPQAAPSPAADAAPIDDGPADAASGPSGADAGAAD